MRSNTALKRTAAPPLSSTLGDSELGPGTPFIITSIQATVRSTENRMTHRHQRVGRNLIYGLLDPRDRCLRYVGKTHKRREFRLAEHVMKALEGQAGLVYDWIRNLQDEGGEPVIFVLERIPAGLDWRLAERYWIDRCRVWPAVDLPHLHSPQTPKSTSVLIGRVDLLNLRDGG